MINQSPCGQCNAETSKYHCWSIGVHLVGSVNRTDRHASAISIIESILVCSFVAYLYVYNMRNDRI